MLVLRRPSNDALLRAAVWLHLAGVFAVAGCLLFLADRWWVATALLFSPRWVFALPLAVATGPGPGAVAASWAAGCEPAFITPLAIAIGPGLSAEAAGWAAGCELVFASSLAAPRSRPQQAGPGRGSCWV